VLIYRFLYYLDKCPDSLSSGLTKTTGQYSFDPDDSWTHQNIIITQPIIGIKPISCHHPLRPMSCSLLDVTAIDGKKTAREHIDPSFWLNTCEPIDRRNVNNIHHQNSDREARPLNSAYFLKQI
jgi:hypothetical protein